MKFANSTPHIVRSSDSGLYPTDPPATLSLDESSVAKPRGLNLGFLQGTVWRNLVLVLGVTTVVGLVAAYFILGDEHLYEGEFQLLVEPVSSEARTVNPVSLPQDGSITSTNPIDYATLINVLQSSGILQDVVERVQTRYPEITLYNLQENLTVERIGEETNEGTKLVRVTYQDTDPERIQFVLDQVAAEYLQFSTEDRQKRIGGGVKFIEEQLEPLQQRVNQLENNLQLLQERYQLTDPAQASQDYAEQVREIQAQRLTAQQEAQALQELYGNLQQQLGLSPRAAIALSSLSEDPRYQSLLQQLQTLETRIALESTRLTEDNPTLQSLRQQQQQLQSRLAQETQSIVGQRVAAGDVTNFTFQNSIRADLLKQLVNTSNSLDATEIRVEAAAQAEAAVNQQLAQLPTVIRQFNTLQRQLDIATRTLNQLLLQRETLRVEAAQKEVPWEVLSGPAVFRDAAGNPIPAQGKLIQKLALAVLAGLLVGIGLALLKERLQNVFYDQQDLEAATKLAVLEEIPFNEGAHQLSKTPADATAMQEYPDLYLEATEFIAAFDALYAMLTLGLNTPIRSLVIGSASAGEGRTTTALHLAEAAASTGQRVLLVDANLHQPHLHSRLELPNGLGLNNLLVQNLDPDKLLKRSPLQGNLFILTAGSGLFPKDKNVDNKLLASEKMWQLMKHYENQFDLVIYDVPHFNESASVAHLAASVDAVLMVVGVGSSDRTTVLQTLNQLKTYHIPVVGIVANRFDRSVTLSSDYQGLRDTSPIEEPAAIAA